MIVQIGVRSILVTLLLCGLTGCGGTNQLPRQHGQTVQSPRPLIPDATDQWLGHAVSYGPHRDGQRPGGPNPTPAQLREDLHLMAQTWDAIRIYGSTGVAADILKIIRDDQLGLKVILGAWIAVEELRSPNGTPEETFPAAVVANRAEIAAAIRLTNTYPDVVVAVSVGNETQIDWSAHRSPRDILLRHVRIARAGVTVPVTVADDFNFWNKATSRAVAAEIDFLTIHAHPMWNGQQRSQALPWLKEQLKAVQSVHPDRPWILGETGWATMVHDQGEQAELIKGAPGEAEQSLFFDEVRAWSESERITVFFFEAFDENWKGGPHPNEVEKHWGVFRTDRSAKQAVSAPRGS